MKKILVIEDDSITQKELLALLKNADYEAIALTDFANALDKITTINPDLILLDICIPYLNGELLLRKIRETSNVPIIMVTSKDNETDR